VIKYLDFVKLLSESAALNPWPLVVNDPKYHTLMPPFREDFLCVAPTSALIELIFSRGQRVLHPHRARLGDRMLAALKDETDRISPEHNAPDEITPSKIPSIIG